MANYKKYIFRAQFREWGNGIWISDHCIAKSLTRNINKFYVKGFGHIVELEMQDWIMKKDEYAGLKRLELDENHEYKDPAKKKEFEEIKNSIKEEE
jgi:hypothetical protein